jgi:hypothetical protein
MEDKNSITWLRKFHRRNYAKALKDLGALVESESSGLEFDDFTATRSFESVMARVVREGAALNALLSVENFN